MPITHTLYKRRKDKSPFLLLPYLLNAACGRNQSRLGLRPDPVGTESQPTKMRAPCAHLSPEDSNDPSWGYTTDLEIATWAGSRTYRMVVID